MHLEAAGEVKPVELGHRRNGQIAGIAPIPAAQRLVGERNERDPVPIDGQRPDLPDQRFQRLLLGARCGEVQIYELEEQFEIAALGAPHHRLSRLLNGGEDLGHLAAQKPSEGNLIELATPLSKTTVGGGESDVCQVEMSCSLA